MAVLTRVVMAVSSMYWPVDSCLALEAQPVSRASALAATASGVSLRVCDALLPRLAHDFDVSLGQASQVITAFAVAYGLSQLVFGPLGDRFGKYRVIGWACAASAVTSLLCALAPGFGANGEWVEYFKQYPPYGEGVVANWNLRPETARGMFINMYSDAGGR